MSSVFPDLAPHERAVRYRALAYEAHCGVEKSIGEDRNSWRFVERQWDRLASKADKDALAESLTQLRTPGF
jgi:hypothetical protein